METGQPATLPEKKLRPHGCPWPHFQVGENWGTSDHTARAPEPRRLTASPKCAKGQFARQLRAQKQDAPQTQHANCSLQAGQAWTGRCRLAQTHCERWQKEGSPLVYTRHSRRGSGDWPTRADPLRRQEEGAASCHSSPNQRAMVGSL